MTPSSSTSSMLLSALVLLSTTTTVVAQNPSPLQLGNLVWSEEFNTNGALDSKLWNYDIGNGNWGWGNGEVQQYTSSADNIKVNGGSAVITVKDVGNKDFRSARIKTNGKVEFQYGSVEVRIKLPNLANGFWPAFWMLGSNFGSVGWPACGEIDILEAGAAASIATGKVNRVVSSAAHWEADGNYASYALERDTGSNFVDNWQVFRLDWTPDAINTFVDGKFIWAFDIGSCKNSHCSEFHAPFYFIANVAIGGRFTGIMDANQVSASAPASMEIDYIRIYDNSEVDAQVTVGGILQAPPNSSPTQSSTPAPVMPAPITPAPVTPAPTPQSVGNNPVGSYDVDCGVPDTCTDAVLGADANGATCYDHIKWLMNARGRDELYACDSIGRKSFPSECGGCDPGTGKPFIDYQFDCGAPNLCNDNVLNHDAPALGATCGERISHLIEMEGWSQDDACAHVSGVEFPDECGECVHAVITCGHSANSACASALEKDAGGHTCRSRISWVVYATGVTELEACAVVANEADNVDPCGPCNPP